MDQNAQQSKDFEDTSTLEAESTVVNATPSAGDASTGTGQTSEAAGSGAGVPSSGPSSKPPKRSLLKRITSLPSKINVYLLLFILLIGAAGLVVVVAVDQSKREKSATTIDTQELSAEDLSKLQSTDVTVGDPKQLLSIESNAVFTGKVLIRDSLDVAGGIKVGGSLSLPGITVSGTSAFDQVTANQLSIAGDTTLQGQLTVQKNLVVSGSATFGGAVSAPQLTVSSLQISGDLTFNRHVDAGGGTPGKSDGTPLGGGGTSSVSGTDTAGTVTINTGSNPTGGCFMTITFVNKFNATPHVVISPANDKAADLRYYVTRNTASFNVCSTGKYTGAAPDAATSYLFDYVVID